MFSKMFVVWCAVAVMLVQADLVPYTLGGTTIMVDSNVLGYNSPLLSSLIQGMPHRSGPEIHPAEENLSSNVQDSLQQEEQHTLSATNYPALVSTDFKKEPDGHLDIKVYHDEESQYSPQGDDDEGFPKPITIEEAAGIYLGDERIPFTNGFRKPPYYSVPTPDVADVSEKIHHIVSALNQETTGAKLNDRAPLPLVPPISDAVGFVGDAQITQYPVQLEELPQETTLGSFASDDNAVNNGVANDSENDDVTTTNSETFGTFSDGDFGEAVTTLGSTSTETYLDDKILQGNIVRHDPDADSVSLSQMSEISNSDDNDRNDFSEIAQTTETPSEESTSIPLEEVLLQKEEELALLHQEEAQNIQEEFEDQMALEQAMADMFGSLFSDDEENENDPGTESSVATPEHDSENLTSTVAEPEDPETQAPISFDPLISESIIHDLNKQVQSSGPETKPVQTNVEADLERDETPAEKQEDDNLNLQIQSSVLDSNTDTVQSAVATDQPTAQTSANEEEEKQSTRPLIAHAAVEADSPDDQTSVKEQEEEQEDQNSLKIIQQVQSSAEDEERKEQNAHTLNKQVQPPVQDTNTNTGHSFIEPNQHSGLNSAIEEEVNQEENNDDAVGVLNANDSTDQEIQVTIHDSSMLADFPPARGGPEGETEPDSTTPVKPDFPTPVQPDVPPPVFLYSPHSLNPITLGQAAGVYVNGEKVFNEQFPEHPSGYSTRHDPPSPDSGLLTWYDQDPINIFDPLQAERITGRPNSNLSPQLSTPSPTPRPSDNEVNVGRPIPGSVPSLRPAVPTNSIPVVSVDNGASFNETTGNRIQTGGAVFHSADPEFLQKSTCRCGLRFNTKIVGGQSTTIDQFPWMAAIASAADNFTFCGGSLLNDKYVLTAAHCVDGQDPRDMYIRFGETTRNHLKSTNIDVKRLIVHKKYDPNVVYKNDIALVELAKPIEAFTDRIFPVCLTTGKESYSEHSAIVSGWGRNSFGGDVTQGLMEAKVNVLSTKNCKQNSFYQKYEVHNKIVCALGDGIDACQGDSGGPLVVLENDQYKQLGVVSWGIGCAQKEYPGIYTRVSAYNKWILANIKDGTGCRVGAMNINRDKNKGNKNKGNKNKNKNKKKNKNDSLIGGSRPLFSILNKGNGNSDKKEEVQQANNNNKQDQKKNQSVNSSKPEAEETKVENQRPGVNNDNKKDQNKNKSPTSAASGGGGLKLPNLRRPGSNNNRNNPNRRKNQNRDRPGQGNKTQNDRQDTDHDQNKKKKPDTASALVTQNPQLALKPASGTSRPAQGQKTATGDSSNNNSNNNNKGNPGGTRNNQKNRPQRNKNKNNAENQSNPGNSDGLNWSNLQEALKGIGQIINKEKVQENDHAIPSGTSPEMVRIIHQDPPL